MEKKITKFDMFTDLKAIVAASVEIDEELKIAYEEMLDKELASLEKRKESAQKRAAAKKEESDALTDEILAVVKNAVNCKVEIVLCHINFVIEVVPSCSAFFCCSNPSFHLRSPYWK